MVSLGQVLAGGAKLSMEQRVDLKIFDREGCRDQNYIKLDGSEDWRICRRSVDVMTGWEMLIILSTSSEEVGRRRDFLWKINQTLFV